MEKTKTCTKCKIEQSIDCFNRDSSRRWGRHPWCKNCSKKLRKSYFDDRKEKKKEYDQIYYSDPDNRERRRRKSEEWYKKNKDKVNAYTLERSKTDLNFKLKGVLRKRIVKIVRGHTKGGSAVEDLGCSIEEFRSYMESLFLSGMTWENYGDGASKWQIDHKDPLCSFDLTDREQFLKACHYTNLQPIWYSDHLTKSIGDRRRK